MKLRLGHLPGKMIVAVCTEDGLYWTNSAWHVVNALKMLAIMFIINIMVS